MIRYADTSLMVAALTPEAATHRAESWLAADRDGHVAISSWTLTEFACALSAKVHNRTLDAAQRRSVLTLFHRMVDESFHTIVVATRHSPRRHDLPSSRRSACAVATLCIWRSSPIKAVPYGRWIAAWPRPEQPWG